MFEGVNHIANHEQTYPVLDRTAFLIEHASVPRHYPVFCAEMGQLLAAMEVVVRQNKPPEDDSS